MREEGRRGSALAAGRIRAGRAPAQGGMTVELTDAFVKEYPLGRLTTVQDVANAAPFVASDECFMTGQTSTSRAA
ncbi:SDR family oxidoreductase [Piscinibacter sp.]|uniref:SDR family oxidoreductase n=1 Tax=Piscinibacter sp. TaxID=1903157 RepID=UPI002F429431